MSVSMESTSDSFIQQNHNLVCPITLDTYRDPVIAGDGHIYERTAIVRWIEQQGTSPLTREPLDANDLRSEENVKQLCQPYRSSSAEYIKQTNMVSLPSVSITNTEHRITCKQHCTVKRILLIITAIICIIGPSIMATSVILYLVRSNSMSTTFTIHRSPHNFTHPSTMYKLPNNCTLSKIVPLFSWNNVQRFNYTYYSKSYQASSTQTMITFAFRHDLSYWCLDNVSIIDIASKKELIINGHFENIPSNGFFRCNSVRNHSTTLFPTSLQSYHGKRSFCVRTVGQPDYLSQRLNTKIGQVYRISFWLQNMGDMLNTAQVLMSY